MNVAIDISPTINGHKGRGIGIYTEQLVSALRTYEPNHQYNVCKATIPSGVDVVHYPYFDPFYLTLPIKKVAPTVVTVHDLIPLVFPRQFPRGFRGAIKWELQKMALRGARQIITDSETSKNDVVKIVGFPEERVHAIYLAPSSVFAQPTPEKASIAVPKKYVLYVGDVNWNKNVLGLMDAMTEIPFDLVCVSRVFENENLPEIKNIRSKIAALGIRDRVHMPGFVHESDLAYLYHHAACTVVPSFYEGFGLPVLEAFAAGGIVVAADNSSLHEIKGPAITVDAESTQDIARGIRDALSLSSKDRSDMVQAGHAWVQQFSWKKVAHDTVRIYEQT